MSLFQNYMFTFFDPTDCDWPRIHHTRFVAALLGTPGHPSPVPHGVVEQLQSRTSARRIVDDPLAPDAWQHIPLGAAVSIVDGPLAGLSGICRISSAKRVQVLLTMLGRGVEVDLPPVAVCAA